MSTIYNGTSLTSGIAVGKAFLVSRNAVRPNISTTTTTQIPIEIEKLSKSVSKTRDQMENSLRKMQEGASSPIQDILVAYLAILNDPAFIHELEENITNKKLKVETLLCDRLDEIHSNLEVTPISEKRFLLSFEDLFYRLYYNLTTDSLYTLKKLFDGLSEPIILVALHLTPLELTNLPRQKLLGIIIEDTTPTSHTAIVSQSLRLPVLVDMPGISAVIHQNELVILDCSNRIAIIDPSTTELNRYETGGVSMPLKSKWRGMPKTIDGVEILIEANVSSLAEAIDVQKQGITNIGLLRSEFYYLGFDQMPSIEQETSFYESIFKEGIDRIDVRLLDIGADKQLPYYHIEEEENPELGMRGVRLLLSKTDLLQKQISAILRASDKGALRVILPFITTLEEVKMIKKCISQLSVALKKKFPMKVGVMVEIPVTILSLADFLPEIDFISVGTNDLIQYLFAADRHNANLKKFSKYDHPLLLQILKDAIVMADSKKVAIKFCGEMASELRGVALLLGTGARILSVQPDAINRIGAFITTHSMADLQKFWDITANCSDEDQREKEWHRIYNNIG
ncbi:MAG TPA: phosphoenolpyruvate--protein phosphotransferase [Chitinispirillaceae bacterium]|nr:phosphoenolpyruvate--protein phosphotransferase [Chitinispirillaceae bacterium]